MQLYVFYLVQNHTRAHQAYVGIHHSSDVSGYPLNITYTFEVTYRQKFQKNC